MATIKEIIQADRERLAGIASQVQDLKSVEIDRIDKQYSDIEGRVKQLQDEKHELLRAPITKSELLEKALASFQRQRKAVIMDDYLLRYLQSCQNSGAHDPFSQVEARLAFGPDQAWKLFYLCLTEDDIRIGVEQLPEIGMTAQQRESKIKAVDDEIQRLAASLTDTQ
jgi:hypothetical protein